MRMKICHLAFALLLYAPSASAEWLLAARDDFSRVYYDPASRERLADGSVIVRALTDYDPQSPQAAPFGLLEKGLSEIETARFDCAANAYRSDGGRWFAGPMATGAVRSDYPAKTTWSTVPPFYADLLVRACASVTR